MPAELRSPSSGLEHLRTRSQLAAIKTLCGTASVVSSTYLVADEQHAASQSLIEAPWVQTAGNATPAISSTVSYSLSQAAGPFPSCLTAHYGARHISRGYAKHRPQDQASGNNRKSDDGFHRSA